MKITKVLSSIAGFIFVALLPLSIIACNQKHSKITPGGIKVEQGPKIATNVVVPESIQSAKILPVNAIVEKSPYTLETLRTEAKKISDDSVWSMGVGEHAVQSSVSIIRALADAFGYRAKATQTNKSQYDIFLEKQGYTLIDDANASQVLSTNTSPMQKFVASLYFDRSSLETSSSKTFMNFGDKSFDPSWLTWIKSSIGSPASKLVMYENKDDADNNGKYGYFVDLDNDNIPEYVNDYFSPYSMWEDSKIPKQRDLLLIDEHDKIYREISLPNFLDTPYPRIEDALFISDYLPYLKAAIAKFIADLIDTVPMLQLAASFSSDGFDINLFLDQISFIMANNLNKEGAIDFNTQLFDDALKRLNNGTQHILALKAFYKGFDSDFTSGLAATFAKIDSIPPLIGWDLNEKLVGLGSISNAQEMLKGNAAFWRSTDENKTVLTTFGFRADKTIPELYANLHISETKRQAILDEIKKQGKN